MSSYNSIKLRRNDHEPMNDDEYERRKSDRRAANVANAREILKRNGIVFQELSLHGIGDGVSVAFNVLKPDSAKEVIPYWPETGRWLTLDRTVRYGCRNLVKYLKGECI